MPQMAGLTDFVCFVQSFKFFFLWLTIYSEVFYLYLVSEVFYLYLVMHFIGGVLFISLLIMIYIYNKTKK